jgi:hypothetical protein
MTQHLFIGGPADGTRHEVDPKLDYFRVQRPNPDPPRLLDFGPNVFGGRPLPVDGYRRNRFAVGRNVVAEVFAYQHMSTEGVFRALIEGYRQGLPADPGEAYDKGVKRGERYGAHLAILAIEADNPLDPAPAWDVFRARAIELIKRTVLQR